MKSDESIVALEAARSCNICAGHIENHALIIQEMCKEGMEGTKNKDLKKAYLALDKLAKKLQQDVLGSRFPIRTLAGLSGTDEAMRYDH